MMKYTDRDDKDMHVTQRPVRESFYSAFYQCKDYKKLKLLLRMVINYRPVADIISINLPLEESHLYRAYHGYESTCI